MEWNALKEVHCQNKLKFNHAVNCSWPSLNDRSMTERVNLQPDVVILKNNFAEGIKKIQNLYDAKL